MSTKSGRMEIRKNEEGIEVEEYMDDETETETEVNDVVTPSFVPNELPNFFPTPPTLDELSFKELKDLNKPKKVKVVKESKPKKVLEEVPPKHLTIREAADKAFISEQYLRKTLKMGKLAHTRKNGKIYVSEVDLLSWMNRPRTKIVEGMNKYWIYLTDDELANFVRNYPNIEVHKIKKY